MLLKVTLVIMSSKLQLVTGVQYVPLADTPVVANTELPPGHTDAGVAPVLLKVIDEDKEMVAVATELHPFTSVPVIV